MNLRKIITNNRGASMIELMIGIVLVAIVMTTISMMTTRSIQLAQASKYRQKAVILAQDGIEMARQTRKETDWQEFISRIRNSYQDLNPENDLSGYREFNDLFDNNVYTRNIYMANIRGNYVQVISEVSWNDFKGSHKVSQETRLYYY